MNAEDPQAHIPTSSPSEGFAFDAAAFPDQPRPQRGRPKSPKRANVVEVVTRAAAKREPITSTQLYAALIDQGISPGSARNAYTGIMRPAAHNPVHKVASDSVLVLDGFHLTALPTVERRAIQALAALPAEKRAPILAALYQALGLPFDPAEVEDVAQPPAPAKVARTTRSTRSPRHAKVVFQGE